MVYDQCSQEVKDKLEGTDDWESIQKDQSLHDLVNKIERICVGFDDHKQEVFNLVQALKTLFIHPNQQGDRRAIRTELSCTMGDGRGVQRLPRNTCGNDRWDAERSYEGGKCITAD